MKKTIVTQQSLIDQLVEKLERAEKFNYNLAQAKIKAKQARIIYQEQPTTENRLRMEWLNSEASGCSSIDEAQIILEIESLIKNN